MSALAKYIQRRQPNAWGFSASNLRRMMQFFETYRGQPKLATLLRVLPWSHNLAIMARFKRPEEREFYLRFCATKNHEVVEYALSRAMSPAVVAEYQTQLPGKKLLRVRLHGFFEITNDKATSAAPILPRPEDSK